jgi:hypothetical protein
MDDYADFDEVQPCCDICNMPQYREGDDWNGETGNHKSCERDSLKAIQAIRLAIVREVSKNNKARQTDAT